MSLIPQSDVSSAVPLYLHVPPISNPDAFAPRKCEEITSKLFAQVYQDFRNVVETMGGNSSQIAMNHEFLPANDWMNAYSYPRHTLKVSRSLLHALNGCDTPFKRRIGLGILAHEAAHCILKHVEWMVVEIARTLGISALKEEIENLLSGEEPFGQQAERLLLRGNRSLFDPEKFNELRRSNEKEADLLTMRVPLYARGLRDGFCSEPFVYEDGGPDYPVPYVRCTYMTDALCDKYPEENQDICSKPVQ